MASGDITSRGVGVRKSQALDRARLMEELRSEQTSNINVGDFLSEMQSAVKYRVEEGLSQGEFILDPSRFLTDGRAFGREKAVASNVKLQITLSLDTSTSMWANRIMRHAGPAFLAFDRIIRKTIQDLPEGAVFYQPFIFHGSAYPVPASYLNLFVGRIEWANKGEGNEIVWPIYPRREQIEVAKEVGELSEDATGYEFRLSGEDTAIAPLFKAIQKWESEKGDPSAVRIDIVLTDGVLEMEGDVEAATQVQDERAGRLQTVLLNFLPIDEWENYQLPDRCGQFAVEPENLDRSIRDILSEAVAQLFE